MNNFDTELTAGLSALVDSPAPPSSMDVARARRTGHSIKRRRAATRSAAAAAAAAIAVLAAVLLPGTGHRSGPPPGADPSATPSVTATAHPALTGTDPLVTTLAFGWLPDGVRTASFQRSTMTEMSDVNSPETTLNAGGGKTVFNLSVLPAGKTFPADHFVGGKAAPHVSAPDVNGRTAYWTFAPANATADSGLELRWEYAADSWAQLGASFSDDTAPDVTAIIYKVAENVHYGQTGQVAAPFHLAEAPSGLTLDGQGWTLGNGWTNGFGPGGQTAPAESTDPVPPWGAGLTYGSAALHQTGGIGPMINIAVQVADGQQPSGPTQPVTIDGHPATVQTTANGVQFAIYGVDGLNVMINVTGSAAMNDINSVGGIVAYYHTITLLGPNSANWTTAVVG